MAKATYIDSSGSKGTEVELPAAIFDVQVNVPVMHLAVRAQLAAARAGTHSTKTRAEVRGGGRKPWRQKGTGRARHGSIREPQWVGGGVAHGPKPKDHSMRINRKVKALALRSALTDRAREGKVLVVDLPGFEEPETSRAVELISTWGAEGKVLLVVGAGNDPSLTAAIKSFRNIPEVLPVTYPTTYTVVAANTIVFTKEALDRWGRDSQDLPTSRGRDSQDLPTSRGRDSQDLPDLEDSVSRAPKEEEGPAPKEELEDSVSRAPKEEEES